MSHPAPLPPSSTSWTLDDIGRLASATGNAAETLSNVVQLIQRRFGTDVCSVYLLGPDRSNLVLAATVGLKPDSVGRIRMRLDEGLVGLVAEELRPLIVDDAPAHPRFKYFKEAGEDPYRSFLGVPLVDRGLLQGVLVLQTVTARAFDPAMVSAIAAAGHQLSHVVSLARTQGQFVAPTQERLRRLANNLWWSWDQDTTSLFRDLDPGLWRRLGHNPVALLPAAAGQRPSTSAPRSWRCMAASTTPTAGSRNTWPRATPGASATPASCGRARSPTSRPSSACTNRCRSTPAASASCPAITSRRRRTSAFRWSASASSTTRATSGSGSTTTMCQQEEYLDVDAATLPIRPATTKDGQTVTVTRRDPHRLDLGARVDGAPSAAPRCCCSTPTSKATRRRIAS